jgi:hypothetical protein
MRRWLRRWVREVGDAWLLFFLPALPALLPWRAAWVCYRAISVFPVLLRREFAGRAAIVADTFPDLQRSELARRLRLLWLLDAADLYIARRTPLADAPGGHFRVRGEWPAGAFVAVSFHYGNGLWTLRDLYRKGRRTVYVLAPFEPGDFRGRRIHLAYARARIAELARSAGLPIAVRPRVREQLLQALANGDVAMSLIDVPPRLVAARQLPVAMLGRHASLPAGIVEIAAAAGVPIVPFWIEADALGRRTLVIEPARPADDIAANVAYFAGLLDRLVRDDPAAWNFWSEWPRWTADAAVSDAA